MDMNNLDDEALVLKFLKEQTSEEIPDNGFTRKVMRHMPEYLEYVALYLELSASAAAAYLIMFHIDWHQFSEWFMLSM